ncbi:MAG: hypothetical protein IPJ65_22945 [Archangiaceae bacterium]|nr:hypothetical protein [Archangiaceae bacterium]
MLTRALRWLCLVLAVSACPSGPGLPADSGPADSGASDGGTSDGGAPDAGRLGFTLRSPTLSVDGGVASRYCWYFRTPNAAAQAVAGFHSSLGPAVTYLGMWLTPTEVMPPGTLVEGCDQTGQLNNGAGWAYSAWQPDAGWSFPTDDGAGQPLGKVLAPNQAGFLYLRVVNGETASASAQAQVDVDLYPPDASVTPADSLTTYNGNINILPNGTDTATATCPAPSGARFTRITVFTHQQAVQTQVKTPGVTLFASTDWENPGASTFSAPSFPTPAALEVSCSYVNPTGRTITAGASPDTDEACMMLSYFFPSARPRLCFNSTLIP